MQYWPIEMNIYYDIASARRGSPGAITVAGRKTRNSPKAAKKAVPKPTRTVARSTDPLSASKLIDARIKELGDWRGETLALVRLLIKQAVPDGAEEIKWRKPSNPGGVPVWSHNGIICTGEAYKDKVKLTFARGAALDDPAGLFNAGLEGNTRRAIDTHEGDKVESGAFKALVKAAVALNAPPAKKRSI